MQDNPLVTVICLCYNHSKFVVECLESVINQSYKNIELIIVDDCSNDNSVAVINQWLIDFPEIKFIVNKTNLGNTKSFNKVVKLAKGDYLIDLAADDVLLSNGVENQLKGFRKSSFKNLAMVYGNAINISENGCFIDYYFEVNDQKKVIVKRPVGNIYLSVLSSGKVICSVSAMIKKDVFEVLNGYDESLAYEDLDFWIRISRNYTIDFIDEIVIQKRVISHSLGSNFKKRNSTINQSTYKILRKAIGLNQSLEEDFAVQKRVHYEIINSYNNKDFSLLLKNVGLKFRLVLRRIFSVF